MSRDISSLRKEYTQAALNVKNIYDDPLQQFGKWFEEALDAELPEVNAMHLGTCDANGKPHGRIVLLKAYDARGFVFYTNYNSQKGAELSAQPFASLTFFWAELERQVRIEGPVEKVSAEESDAYFKSRPLGSQIGALASPQSQQIESREWLESRFQQIQSAQHHFDRPEYWGGYMVQPELFEFWQGRPGRLHDRLLFKQSGEQWVVERLAP